MIHVFNKKRDFISMMDVVSNRSERHFTDNSCTQVATFYMKGNVLKGVCWTPMHGGSCYWFGQGATLAEIRKDIGPHLAEFIEKLCAKKGYSFTK